LLNIAVLISGSGSNLKSIIDKINEKQLNCVIEYVISDNEEAYGIERAQKYGIKTVILNKKSFGNSLSDRILEIIDGKVDLIVLAGYLSILKGDILKKFKNRIINIHPALIPSFSGKGMYGINVHKAVIDYGVKVSGCTVHMVDEGTDTGPIIIQRTVPVYAEDSPEELQKRVLEEEHKALPEAIGYFCNDKIKLKGRKVTIL